jgi:hypothetical protein
VERVLDRVQLRVRAWQEALDPSTHTWVTEARAERSTGDAKAIRDEVVRKIEQARQGTSQPS